MDNRKPILPMLLPATGILILILDSKTAITGAAEGIELCLHSIIPSIFPFLMLSIFLTNTILGQSISPLVPIGKICGLPRNAEALFLIGLLGGYPVGAQAVTEAYRRGVLPRDTARRLLGFCSNAGPAFIFGITGCLFSDPCVPWILWLIHILSAMAVGAVLPRKANLKIQQDASHPISCQQAFTRSLHIMAAICGWVVLFRVLISFLGRWFLWLLPETAGVFTAGLFELANGIIALQSIASETSRFILCSILLGFGGVCVGMQTASVTGELGTGLYIPGKLLQGSISCVLSAITALCIYGPYPNSTTIITLAAIISVCIIAILRTRKIAVAFWRTFVYNGRKSLRELPLCSFERK